MSATVTQLARPACASTYSMLLISASCVSGLSRSQRAERRPAAGGRSPSTCSSSRTMRSPASAICARSRETRTFSSRSSCLTSPRRAALMNEFSLRRLLQRPRRVPREEPERRERRRAGRPSGAAAPAPSAAAGARRQTTGTAPSTGRRARPARARARTRAGTAARRPRAR